MFRNPHADRSLIFASLVLAVLVVLCISGCKKKFSPEEQIMLDELRPYFTYLEDYKRANLCYPASWDVLLNWKRVDNPENPFTGEPMVVLESLEFDPDVSPGNIYYITVVREDCVINCQVILFNQRREFYRYSHAGPFAAR